MYTFIYYMQYINTMCLLGAMAALYLVDDVFIVADVIFKGHNRIPGIILGVKAAAGGLIVFMTRHSYRVPAGKQDTSYWKCYTANVLTQQ